jgi:UDP-2,3-diacylglucosamine hydrolase
MAETLFISDLHLSQNRPALLAHFVDFLKGRARRAQALYILGDLFDVWLGDDDDVPAYRPLIEALHELAESGVALFFLPGNRDFSVGARFSAASACRILPDPWVVDVYATPTLLMHGDSLCRDDRAYQLFRRLIRARATQALLHTTPVKARRALANILRRHSQAQNQRKAAYVMDVNLAEVSRMMRKYQVTRLIHGHTHCPAIHEFCLDEHPASRMVLGDWQEQRARILVCTPAGCTLESLFF